MAERYQERSNQNEYDEQVFFPQVPLINITESGPSTERNIWKPGEDCVINDIWPYQSEGDPSLQHDLLQFLLENTYGSGLCQQHPVVDCVNNFIDFEVEHVAFIDTVVEKYDNTNKRTFADALRRSVLLRNTASRLHGQIEMEWDRTTQYLECHIQPAAVGAHPQEDFQPQTVGLETEVRNSAPVLPDSSCSNSDSDASMETGEPKNKRRKVD